jgi:hypothetical protein
MCLTVGASIVVQMRPSNLNHLSRWGHWAAGQWLAAHARPNELILDTRGWARFISGRPGYDYWHVRQALTDSHLSYVLVGLDEPEASPRAATLKALLFHTATPRLRISPHIPANWLPRFLPLPPAQLGKGPPGELRIALQRWVRGVN